MIIFYKNLTPNYTYQEFLRDFNIDIRMFENFNRTVDGSRRKRLDQKLSTRFAYTDIDTFYKNGFEGTFYIAYSNGKPMTMKMDFKYYNDYLYKDVSAQTFIYTLGLILNSELNEYYSYEYINSFYKCMRDRNDNTKHITAFDKLFV